MGATEQVLTSHAKIEVRLLEPMRDEKASARPGWILGRSLAVCIFPFVGLVDWLLPADYSALLAQVQFVKGLLVCLGIALSALFAEIKRQGSQHPRRKEETCS